MIATLGETSGYYALKYMKEKMESSEEGIEILRYLPIYCYRVQNFVIIGNPTCLINLFF